MSFIFTSYEEWLKGQEPFIISVSLNHDGSVLLLGFNVEWQGPEYIAKYNIKEDTIEIFENPPGVTLVNPHFHPIEDWFAVNLVYSDADIRIGLMDLDGNLLAVQPAEPTLRRVIEDVGLDGTILSRNADMSVSYGTEGQYYDRQLWEAFLPFEGQEGAVWQERQLTNIGWANKALKGVNTISEGVYVNLQGVKSVLLRSRGNFGKKRFEITNEYDDYPTYEMRDIDSLEGPKEDRLDIFTGKALVDDITTDYYKVNGEFVRKNGRKVKKNQQRSFTWNGVVMRSTSTDKVFTRIRGVDVPSVNSKTGKATRFSAEIFEYDLLTDDLKKVTDFKHYFKETHDVSGDGQWVIVYSIKAGSPWPRGTYIEGDYALRLIDMTAPLPVKPEEAILLDIKPRVLQAYNKKFGKNSEKN